MSDLREALAKFRVLSNSMRTNLHDARTWHPENFNLDGVDELIRQWDESVRPIVEIEAALASQPSGPKETSVEKGLIMGNPVAELQEKVKFLQGELVAIETKAGIESVFEQEKEQGRVEAASDLRAKLESLRDEWMKEFHELSRAHFLAEGERIGNVYRVCAERLTAIIEGKD